MKDYQLPAQTILLYEQVFLDEGNYAGNFRFCFDVSGGYFHNSNKEFAPTKESDWDTDFDTVPTLQLNAVNTEALLKAIKAVNWRDLSDMYPEIEKDSEEMFFERWTYFDQETVIKQVKVWSDKRPEALNDLRKQLDQILEAH